MTDNIETYRLIVILLERMRSLREKQTPDKVRFHSITITKTEDVYAYFRTYVLTMEEIDEIYESEQTQPE